MKKRRILKKWYNRAIENLKRERKKWIDAQKEVAEKLRQVQIMHERAVTTLKKDRDTLQARVRELEHYKTSLDMPTKKDESGNVVLDESFDEIHDFIEENKDDLL